MPKKVVIVDDEPEVADILEGVIAAKGFETYVAADGNAGLEAVQMYGPDIIITDFNMPGLDGLGMAKKLRDRGVRTPIYMTSSDAIPGIPLSDKFRDKMGQYGIREADLPAYVNGFLSKPYDFEEIGRVLGTIPATPEQ